MKKLLPLTVLGCMLWAAIGALVPQTAQACETPTERPKPKPKPKPKG